MYKSIDYAIQAVDRGYYVAPACTPLIGSVGCNRHGESCSSPGKVPVFDHSAVTNKIEDVYRLWTKDYNILCKTKESNLIVLDLDLKPDKPEGLQWIKRNQREGRLNTRQHRTGSGGTHYVYKIQSEDVSIFHGDRICRGLDLRGTSSHHYIIWVGSRHENGRFYEVVDDTEPELLPQWLSDEIQQTKAKFDPNIFTPQNETILEQLWNAAGLPIHLIDNRKRTVKYWIPCLQEHTHTSGSSPFDCVLMSGEGIGRWGSYVCQHQSHKRITSQSAIAMLKQRISEDIYEQIVGKYKKNKPEYSHLIRSIDDCTNTIKDIYDTIDDKIGKIVVVQVTTGTGKTEEALRYLGNHGHQPTNIFVPNHNLATEFVERLTARTGIEAAHPRGISNFKDNESCVFPQMVQDSNRIKLPVRQSVCIRCTHFNDYKGTGEKCKAGHAAASMNGRHRVLQHSSLDAVLRDASSSGGNKLLIVDEQPELITTQELNLSIFDNDDAFELYGVESTDAARYRQLSRLIVSASKIFKGFATAKDVVSVGKNGRNMVFDFNDESINLLKEISSKELPYPFETASRIAQRITLGFSDAPKKLKLLADVFTLLYGLRTACVYPNRECFKFHNNVVTLRVPATWIVEATKYCQSGGKVLLMSASANIEVLKETLGDLAEFVQIHAADAYGVTRSFRYDNRVSRKALLNNGITNQGAIRGALNRIYEDLADYGDVKECLLITHKPVADALRNKPELYFPIPWIRQIEAGGIAHIAHYGAILGLDMYKHVDSVITLGDPIMNIDVAEAESKALGTRFESYLNFKTQSELLQSWGRIRACRRTKPCLILHAGLRKPDVTLDPSWVKWVLPDVD